VSGLKKSFLTKRCGERYRALEIKKKLDVRKNVGRTWCLGWKKNRFVGNDVAIGRKRRGER
jgi:hypothetical protein